MAASALNQDRLTKFSLNILIGVTGSVAAIKLTQIIRTIQADSANLANSVNIKVVLTESARNFVQDEDVINAGAEAIHIDEDEWKAWKSRGDPVLHIELRKWADVAIIAPLDANTLAKLSTGLADNLLTCVCRAWDFKRAPILFAPAMNTLMWSHPVTEPQIETLKKWGYVQIPPIEKTLMCKDVGMGAMAEPDTIYAFLKETLKYRNII